MGRTFTRSPSRLWCLGSGDVINDGVSHFIKCGECGRTVTVRKNRRVAHHVVRGDLLSAPVTPSQVVAGADLIVARSGTRAFTVAQLALELTRGLGRRVTTREVVAQLRTLTDDIVTMSDDVLVRYPEATRRAWQEADVLASALGGMSNHLTDDRLANITLTLDQARSVAAFMAIRTRAVETHRLISSIPEMQWDADTANQPHPSSDYVDGWNDLRSQLQREIGPDQNEGDTDDESRD